LEVGWSVKGVFGQSKSVVSGYKLILTPTVFCTDSISVRTLVESEPICISKSFVGWQPGRRSNGDLIPRGLNSLVDRSEG